MVVTGGVSLNQIGHASNLEVSHRDPYSFYGSANVNIALYGWNIPFQISYSNRRTAFHQPFNQVGIHPVYRWITGHLGYTALTFSPLTVNGHLFLGGGVELRPGRNWKISALYGRFLKAAEPDTLMGSSSRPSYQRNGYGIKVGYGDERNFAGITFFHAGDEINSLEVMPDEQGIFPEENLVLGFDFGKRILKNWIFKGEMAFSALSHDIRADEVHDYAWPGTVRLFYTPRISSSFYQAGKASLDYQGKFFSGGMGYERIPPGYRTLGAYFFNNDLESIHVHGNTSWGEGKVNVFFSLGLQRDNLDEKKISATKRKVGNLNLHFMPGQHFNLSASYSNFQTYTQVQNPFQSLNQLTPYDYLDTLNYHQVTQNASLQTAMMLKGGEDGQHRLNFSFNFQEVNDFQEGMDDGVGNQLYYGNAHYGFHWRRKNTVSILFNASLYEGTLSSRRYGPGFSLYKILIQEKLRFNFSSTYQQSRIGGGKSRPYFNTRAGGNLTIRDRHQWQLNMVWVRREELKEEKVKNFQEFTVMLGYQYRWAKKKKG